MYILYIQNILQHRLYSVCVLYFSDSSVILYKNSNQFFFYFVTCVYTRNFSPSAFFSQVEKLRYSDSSCQSRETILSIVSRPERTSSIRR